MMISINKKQMNLPNDITVSSLLEILDIESKFIAVEINMVIIPKSEFNTHKLREHDNVEVINPVGGG
tara:strand:+ start:7497 stop:7697 length:201 start_codon:yes stop_codon:yes gene_type:complete